MTRTSEYVSLGHPDAVADFIVSYILDRYLEKDPRSRFALECQIKDNFVTLGGEITSTAEFDDVRIAEMVKEAVVSIGYTSEYSAWWGWGNAIDPEALVVTVHVSKQSPDIAQGVDAEGWGDQGIMWGMACGTSMTDFMPEDHYIAKAVGETLYGMAKDRRLDIGLDIKTQITMADDDIAGVIIAAPMKDTRHREAVRSVARDVIRSIHPDLGPDVPFVVNGTGAYVRHASQGDCGTTGRKLAVDFYGGNCRIGGGCPWGKDPTKADVTLNVYARELALDMLEKTGRDVVYCSIACCIGRPEITVAYYDEHMNEISSILGISRPAPEVIADLGLRRPVFAWKKAHGLFTVPRGEAV